MRSCWGNEQSVDVRTRLLPRLAETNHARPEMFREWRFQSQSLQIYCHCNCMCESTMNMAPIFSVSKFRMAQQQQMGSNVGGSEVGDRAEMTEKQEVVEVKTHHNL